MNEKMISFVNFVGGKKRSCKKRGGKLQQDFHIFNVLNN